MENLIKVLFLNSGMQINIECLNKNCFQLLYSKGELNIENCGGVIVINTTRKMALEEMNESFSFSHRHTKYLLRNVFFMYLFNFPEEIWDIQPFNASVVKKVSRGEINWLKNPLFNNILNGLKMKEDEEEDWTNCTFYIKTQIYLFARLLMLPEQVIKDSTVLLVDPLHLIDVLRHLLHSNQGLNQMLVLVRVGIS